MVDQCNKDHLQTVHKDIHRPIRDQGQIPRPPIIVAQPVNTQDHNLRPIREAVVNIQGNSLLLIQEVVTNIQDHRVHQVPGDHQAVHLIREVRVAVTVVLQAVHHEVVLHPVILHLQEVAHPAVEVAVDLTLAVDLPQAAAIVAVAIVAMAVAAPVDAGNYKI